MFYFLQRLLGFKRETPVFVTAKEFYRKIQNSSEYENDIPNYHFSAAPFEKEFKKVMQTPAISADFIRMNATISLDKHLYNFTFKAGVQVANFYIIPPVYIEDIWKFLENLALGKEKSFILTKDNHSNSLLTAQKVDEENIRLTIINDSWLEPFFNRDFREIDFREKTWSDKKAHIAFDVVLPKKHFIYTFYQSIRDIFNRGGEYELTKSPIEGKYSQVESLIVSKYLGYVPAEDLDIMLLEALNWGSVKEVKKLLEKGANPNALHILPEDYWGYKEIPYTIMESYWGNEGVLGGTLEGEFSFTVKSKLLLKYGAMPRDFYNLFFNSRQFEHSTPVKIFEVFFKKHPFLLHSFWANVLDSSPFNDGPDYWPDLGYLVRDIIPTINAYKAKIYRS